MFVYFIRTAFANLKRRWRYSVLVLLTLTLALSSAIMIATFVRDEYRYDKFLPDHERLLLVRQTLTPPGNGSPLESDATRSDLAAALKLDFPSIESVSRLFHDEPLVGRAPDLSVEKDFYWADPNFLSTIRLKVLRGDGTAALNSPDGLALTRSAARRYFGEENVVGRTLTLNRAQPFAPTPHVMRVRAIIDDLPPTSHLKIEMLGSGSASFSPLSPSSRAPVSPFGMQVLTYIRLRAGSSINDISNGMEGFTRRHISPAPLMGSKLQMQVVPITAIHLLRANAPLAGNMKPRGDVRQISAIALVGGTVLLIAAINFVALMTTINAQRAGEVGIRKAYGASASDVAIQFICETALYVVLSCLIAAALAETLSPAFGAVVGRDLRINYIEQLDLVLGILTAAFLLTFCVGLYPSLVQARMKPSMALRGGNLSLKSGKVRNALVAGQFAIVICLIICTVTIYRQTAFAARGTAISHSEEMFWINEPCSARFLERIRDIPGVVGAACSSPVPLLNGGAPTTAAAAGQQPVTMQMAPIDDAFLSLYDIRPVAGRHLTQAMGEDTRTTGGATGPSLVLNETAAKKLGFSDVRKAVGKSIMWRRLAMNLAGPPQLLPPQPSTVVGVIPDFSMASVRSPIEPMLFYYDAAMFHNASVRISSGAAPTALPAINKVWREMGSLRPMQGRSMSEAMTGIYRELISVGNVLAASAIIGVVIACLGLLALAAFVTEVRTKEIGIRKALGASTFSVVRMLLSQFSAPILIANLISLPIAWLVLKRWLQEFAFHIPFPIDLFILAPLVSLAAGWGIVWLHAYQAASQRPTLALRYE